jgi:hypothetical protein
VAEMTTGALGVRLGLMQEITERAKDLELEGCAVRIGIDGARMWLSVDFAACAPVDPFLRELRDFEKSAPAFAPRGSAAADPAPEPEPVADLQPEPVAEPEPAPEPVPGAVERIEPSPKPVAPESGHLALWTQERDVELAMMLREGRSWEQISAETGRTVAAVQQRVKRHGGRTALIAWAQRQARLAKAVEPAPVPVPEPERKAEPAAAEEVDPDAPGALAAHLARVIGTGGWTRAQDCELIRLACLGWSVWDVEALDLTGTGASVSARHAVLTAKRRWSIYEIAAALGVETGEAAA